MPDKAFNDFVAWLDKDVLADAAYTHLKEARIPVTPENLRTLWLNFLETELHHALQSCVENMPTTDWKF